MNPLPSFVFDSVPAAQPRASFNKSGSSGDDAESGWQQKANCHGSTAGPERQCVNWRAESDSRLPARHVCVTSCGWSRERVCQKSRAFMLFFTWSCHESQDSWWCERWSACIIQKHTVASWLLKVEDHQQVLIFFSNKRLLGQSLKALIFSHVTCFSYFI